MSNRLTGWTYELVNFCYSRCTDVSEMLKKPKYLYGPDDKIVSAKLNTGEYLLNQIWEHKDTVALINGATQEELKYGEIAQEAMNLAVSLVRVGIRKGDVVALCSENRREFWSTVIGVACTGAVVTTINMAYTRDELKHVMGIAKPKYIFCSPLSFKAHSKTLRSLSYLKTIVLYGDQKQQNTLLYNDLAIASTQINDGPDKITENVQFDKFHAVDVRGDDTLFVLYSSGTTGLPKGVMLSQLSVLTAITPNPNIPTVLLKPLTVTPWFHTLGLVSTLINFVRGVTVVFLPRFDVEQYFKTIEKYRISQLVVVPPVLVALCKTQLPYDVSSVEIVYSGAAPLYRETVEAVMKRFPNVYVVLQGYGMTECTLAITLCLNPDKIGSVGSVTSNTVVKVVNPETREVLGPNQEGEICVKGVMVMKGYIGKDLKDDFDEEGFFKTGDIGYYDEDEYFYIVDRLKELIKYKGYQVAPAEIEALLLKHEGVRDAGVVGIPHAGAGEVPLAFVVLQPRANITEKEIKDFVAERLSNPKHLRGGVRFIDEIPKNPSGKILRKELRKLVKSKRSKL